MIIALRVKIIGVKNTAEKMKKCYHFFLFSYKMITTTYYLCRKRNSCEGNNRRRKELFFKIPCFEKKLKLRNDNAFFVFQRNPLKYIFFLKDNLCEFHLREQFFCRNTLINPVLIVRKLQYDYHAF